MDLNLAIEEVKVESDSLEYFQIQIEDDSEDQILEQRELPKNGSQIDPSKNQYEIQNKAEIKKMIRKVIENNDENESQILIRGIQNLLERNKQLEREKYQIIHGLKDKVQQQGNILLQKFNSFGNHSDSNYDEKHNKDNF